MRSADPAGVSGIYTIVMTPDASAYAYLYNRHLSRLYLARGMR